MAFALFDFIDSSTIEVGKIDLIVWNDDKPDDVSCIVTEKRVVRVHWPATSGKSRRKKEAGEQYRAQVIEISDDVKYLRSLAADIAEGRKTVEEVPTLAEKDGCEGQGRGQRLKFAKHKLSDSSQSENDDDVPLKQIVCEKKQLKAVKSNAAAKLLQQLKESRKEDVQTDDSMPSISFEEKVVDDAPSTIRSNAVAKVLQNIKHRQRQREETQLDETRDAKVKKLEEENKQLRNALSALSYLPTCIDQLRSIFPDNKSLSASSAKSGNFNKTQVDVHSPQPDRIGWTSTTPTSSTGKGSTRHLGRNIPHPSSSQSPTPSTPTTASTPTNPVVALNDDEKECVMDINETLLAKCCKSNQQKFVNDLLSAMFTEDYLATHTQGGKSSKESNKSAMEPQIQQQIIGNRVASHGGYLFGFHSQATVYPELKIGIFTCANGQSNGPGGMSDIHDFVARLILDPSSAQDVAEPKTGSPSLSPSDAALYELLDKTTKTKKAFGDSHNNKNSKVGKKKSAREASAQNPYVGVYYNFVYGNMSISVDDSTGRLRGDYGDIHVDMVPIGKDKFAGRPSELVWFFPPLQMSFGRSDDGETVKTVAIPMFMEFDPPVFTRGLDESLAPLAPNCGC